MDSELVQQINATSRPHQIDFASFGALAFQLCEFLHSFVDEAEYLCKSRFTVVKSLYIWSRYITLVGQIVSLALTRIIYEEPLCVQLCVGTFVYKAILAQLTLSCVEIILLIRVYALYNQSRRVKYFLCTVFLANCAMETWSNGQIVMALMKGKSCIPDRPPPAAIATISASAACFQVFILCMTVFKYVIGRRYGLARTPLTSLLLREGIAVCFLLVSMLLSNVTYESIHKFGPILEDATLSWFISLLSVTGCRLILDMRRLVVPHPALISDENDEIVLTSNLGLTSSLDMT